MNRHLRNASLIAGLGLVTLLAGCPGMPGAPGGGGSAAQQTPPGILPPPGLESGGVRTLMGTTVTPPNNQILLVNYATPSFAGEAQWRSVRRVTFVDGGVLLEGLNYDERAKGPEKDRNLFLPLTQVAGLSWKYEPKPTPPAPAKPAASAGKAKPEAQGKRGR
jgi:hypothetical protein